MKIEQLVVQHLYNNKELGLQGFGTFRLKPREDHSPEEQSGDTVLQQAKDIIEFNYDPRTTDDNALLLYIVQQTGKMKALAAADIESYLVLAKQFLNIGKPFVIEGIGTLQKGQHGEYSFVQGAFVAPRIDEQSRPLREKQEEPISFKQEINSIITKRNIQIAGIFALILAFGITTAIILISRKSTPDVVATVPAPVVTTITDTTTKATDSSVKKDTVAATVTPAPPAPVKISPVVYDSNIHFKILIKTFPNADSAESAYTKYRADGYKVQLYPSGDKYKLVLPCRFPLADSTKLRDSIHMVFGGATRVELP